MGYNLLTILWQGFFLSLPAVGFGYALWLIAGRPAAQSARTLLGFGLAGFALHALLLQSLVYLGFPLRETAGWAVIISLVCLGHGFWQGWRKRWKLSSVHRREVSVYLFVFSLVFMVHAVVLTVLGPSRFFGNGHHDQANYVVTADFLAEEPFATKVEDVGYRPWLLRALEVKEQRITECIILGATAVSSNADSQSAYGTVNVFLLALAGVSTAAWLREVGLPRWAVACAGIGAALSPAFTRIYLDGFFSQTATLFVYPALSALICRRGLMRREEGIITSVLLAYLIGTYSEVGVLGCGLVVLSLMTAPGPWRTRYWNLMLILAGAFLLNPGYFSRLIGFLVAQSTKTDEILALGILFPEAGTWVGWGRLFMDLPVSAVVLANGLLIAGLGAWGCLSLPRSRQRMIILTVGLSILPLLILRMMPVFSGYTFTKIAMHFVPIWVGMAMAGAVVSFRRSKRRWLVAGIMWVWVVAMVGTNTPALMAIVKSEGALGVLASASFQETRRDLKSHGDRTYLVAHDDPLVAQWLCYFGRHAQVAFDRRNLGDRIVPTETYGFRRWLNPNEQLWWLDPVRKGQVMDYEPPPSVKVEGAIEVGATGVLGKYYVAGSTLDFILTRALGDSKLRQVWLDLAFIPSNGSEACTIELTDPIGRIQRTTLTAPGWKRWQLSVPAGESFHRLRLSRVTLTPAETRLAIIKSISVEVATVPIDPYPVGFIQEPTAPNVKSP